MTALLFLLGLTAMTLALGYVGVSSTPGGSNYQPIWFGNTETGVSKQVDPSAFKTTGLVDAGGTLRPGTFLQANLTPVSGGSQTVVYVVAYPTQVAAGNTDALLDASADQLIALQTGGRFLRSAIEFNLGRVLSANELAALAANPRFTLV